MRLIRSIVPTKINTDRKAVLSAFILTDFMAYIWFEKNEVSGLRLDFDFFIITINRVIIDDEVSRVFRNVDIVDR